jgi:hypothetical protein
MRKYNNVAQMRHFRGEQRGFKTSLTNFCAKRSIVAILPLARALQRAKAGKSSLFRVLLRCRFRHCEPEQNDPRGRAPCQGQKGGAIPKMPGDEAGKRGGECSTDTLRCKHGALRDIEPKSGS